MEVYDLHTIVITLVSSVMGGGFGSYIMRLIMKNEAKEALKPELQKIENTLSAIQKDYVTCKECTAKHLSTDKILEDMNHKLDIVIEAIISHKKTK